MGTHTDISARKQAEEELNQYQQRLEKLVEDRTQKLEERVGEVEKLNAALSNILDDYQTANEKLSLVTTSLSDTNRELESLTYLVSNDLRDPLHDIKEISESLVKEKSSSGSKKSKELLSQINKHAAQMEQIVNDMLTLSELGQATLSLEDTDPGPLIELVLKTFSPEIKDREISVKVEELPHCQADPALLKTVFANLVSNGIKFTHHGGITARVCGRRGR